MIILAKLKFVFIDCLPDLSTGLSAGPLLAPVIAQSLKSGGRVAVKHNTGDNSFKTGISSGILNCLLRYTFVSLTPGYA